MSNLMINSTKELWVVTARIGFYVRLLSHPN